MFAGPYALLIKAGLVVVLAASLFGSGFYFGHHSAVKSQQAKIVQHVLIQTRYLPQETKVIHDKVVQIKIVHDRAQAAITLVPDNRACDVPAPAIGLLNANRGALPSVQ
jgi:hypothetical protein